MSRETLETIFARRSVRKYSDEAVSEADIRSLLEAAMAAPSASNNKPWHFVVVTERQKLDALATAHPYGKMLHRAPLCIAVCARPSESKFWVQDCSAATENVLIAVAALGLGAVWIGVHPEDERIDIVRRELGIPVGAEPLCLIAIGHPAEKKEPRTQYDEERVHQETW